VSKTTVEPVLDAAKVLYHLKNLNEQKIPWTQNDIAELKRVVKATYLANPSGPKRRHVTDVDEYVEILLQNHNEGRFKIR